MADRYLRASAMVAMTLAVMLAAGCANAAGTPAQNGVEKPDLTVAAVPVADDVGVYIAQQRGLFSAQGLHVKIVPIISSETAISTQVRGGYDITVGNYVSYIQAQVSRHANLRIVAEGSLMQAGDQALYTLPGSPIKNVNELRRKRIGVNVLGNIGTLLISSVLAEHGIAPSSVQFVPVNFPQMVQELRDHAIDAAWLPEPFASLAEVRYGAQKLVDLDQGATQDFPVGCDVVTKTWALRYPQTLAAFLRALTQAQEIADSSRPAVERALETYTGVPPLIAAVMAIDTYPLTLHPVRVQRVADAMFQFGLIHRPFTVRSMIG
jgi:NitT/TauT family transport system substrate-binding protein